MLSRSINQTDTQERHIRLLEVYVSENDIEMFILM